ncbi:MAG: hypothetical protein OXI51_02770 [Chloroflexota bacterium]|nr:hypothetical protein [Chloroflexota bacterium]
MSSRRPRRQRRRRERASTLPRPGATPTPQPAGATAASIPDQTPREHHVATDYRYVRRDLGAVAVVSVLTLAFVLVMAVIA